MLSLEQYQEIHRKNREIQKKMDEECAKIRDQELLKMGINPYTQKPTQPKYDSIYAPENSTAVVIYIAVMIGSLIFKDFWMIWIVATLIFSNFMSRHNN